MNTNRRKLVVAVDGSAAADAAVGSALEVATAMDATLLFIHAVSPLAEELFGTYPEEGPPLEEILARDPVLAAAMTRAGEQGLEADVAIVADEGGSVELATEIAGIAAGSGATMIVTGSRGRGTMAGAVLGSVSHNLIRYASVPVLVVHDPSQQHAG